MQVWEFAVKYILSSNELASYHIYKKGKKKEKKMKEKKPNKYMMHKNHVVWQVSCIDLLSINNLKSVLYTFSSFHLIILFISGLFSNRGLQNQNNSRQELFPTLQKSKRSDCGDFVDVTLGMNQGNSEKCCLIVLWQLYLVMQN